MINGEIPVTPIWESDDVFVFLDQNPVNFGHCLVVPKKHYENIEETPEEVLKLISGAIKIVGKKIKNNLGYDGYNVVVNNGEVAGQEVMHTHWHVIPRTKAGEAIWPEHKKYSEEEKEETIKKLKK
jgi:histidine triad (HIT) family protein